MKDKVQHGSVLANALTNMQEKKQKQITAKLQCFLMFKIATSGEI